MCFIVFFFIGLSWSHDLDCGFDKLTRVSSLFFVLNYCFFSYESFYVINFLKKFYSSIFDLLRIEFHNFSIFSASNQIMVWNTSLIGYKGLASVFSWTCFFFHPIIQHWFFKKLDFMIFFVFFLSDYPNLIT
jgi:hypothetical protein